MPQCSLVLTTFQPGFFLSAIKIACEDVLALILEIATVLCMGAKTEAVVFIKFTATNALVVSPPDS